VGKLESEWMSQSDPKYIIIIILNIYCLKKSVDTSKNNALAFVAYGSIPCLVQKTEKST